MISAPLMASVSNNSSFMGVVENSRNIEHPEVFLYFIGFVVVSLPCIKIYNKLFDKV